MTNSLTFKFLIVGDGAVGKTSIVRRMCHNTFSDNTEETVGVEFMPLTMNIDKSSVKLQIWDTAGQEQYRSLGRAYYRNAVGVLLVFSYDDHSSFEHLDQWLTDVRTLCHQHAQILLVGNKCDLSDHRRVTSSEIEQFISTFEVDFIELSAKNNLNVEQAFYTLTRNVLQAVVSNEIILAPSTQPKIPQVEVVIPQKKGCC